MRSLMAGSPALRLKTVCSRSFGTSVPSSISSTASTRSEAFAKTHHFFIKSLRFELGAGIALAAGFDNQQ